MKQNKYVLLPLLLAICLILTACSYSSTNTTSSLSTLADYSASPYAIVNNNEPSFSPSNFTTRSIERYSELDIFGRCQTAFANLSKDTMPTEKRGYIGQVKPSGWQISKYDFIEGKYLYNRCHLIGFQLSGENSNERNLITGTRYLNTEGMLPFENLVAEYIKESGNHVLYRVRPLFEGINLIASGVQIEAKSVEDEGKGICFNVFCYNVQPGVEIDYLSGNNSLSLECIPSPNTSAREETYILNSNTKKFHYPDCSSVFDINDSNKIIFRGTRDVLISSSYEPCGICKP